MSLTVDARHALGAFQLEVHVELGAGLTALIGRSGSGKTTLLNVIAGVVRADRSVVQLDDVRLSDTASGLWQPAYRRQIGYVFQEPRLLPHLTVRQNLLYGHWFRGQLPGGVPVDEVIGLLNLGPVLSRRPSRLSGGEKQRVALGRALLSRPKLLLLDEPLASVDQAHRAEILPYFDRLRAEYTVPAVYVTHTWAEVSGRADHVVELEAGRVAFSGSVADAEARAAGGGPGL